MASLKHKIGSKRGFQIDEGDKLGAVVAHRDLAWELEGQKKRFFVPHHPKWWGTKNLDVYI